MAKQNNKVASLPAKKKEDEKVEYVDVTEMVEKFKEVELMKLDHMIEKQCTRIDFWMDIKLAAVQYFGEKSYHSDDLQITKMAEKLLQIYKDMRAIVQNLVEDEFLDDQPRDLYSGLYKSWKEISTTPSADSADFFYQYLVYQHVAPFGSQLERLYLAIQDALGPIPEA